MAYKPGQIITKFRSKKGKEIVLKIPKFGWEKQYRDYINSIIAEDDYIIYEKPLLIKDEREFIQSKLEEIKEKRGFCLTAFYKNKIIGSANVNFNKARKKHVATFGIAIADGYREEGVGSKMMEILFEYAKRVGIRIIVLEVFVTNKRAIAVYKKMGFIKYGELPCAIYRRGKFINTVLMYKNL